MAPEEQVDRRGLGGAPSALAPAPPAAQPLAVVIAPAIITINQLVVSPCWGASVATHQCNVCPEPALIHCQPIIIILIIGRASRLSHIWNSAI